MLQLRALVVVVVLGGVRYNATKTSYAQGLKNGDELLLGKVVGTVQPSGTVTAMVDAHGVKAFRLRGMGMGSSKREL
jgi:alpha-galactosidase